MLLEGAGSGSVSSQNPGGLTNTRFRGLEGQDYRLFTQGTGREDVFVWLRRQVGQDWVTEWDSRDSYLDGNYFADEQILNLGVGEYSLVVQASFGVNDPLNQGIASAVLTPVPEPVTLVGIGIGLVGIVRRRRRDRG